MNPSHLTEAGASGSHFLQERVAPIQKDDTPAGHVSIPHFYQPWYCDLAQVTFWLQETLGLVGCSPAQAERALPLLGRGAGI
jgi:hypothetical protein